MSELVTKSVPQEQQEQKIETRTAVKRIAGFTIVATAVAVLAVLGAVVLSRKAKTTTSTRWYRLAELRSPTSGDTRTGLTSLPPGPTKYSR
jgi:hypothetical protein